jgi:hypothetical protein
MVKYCILCLWTSNLDKTFCEYFGKQEEKNDLTVRMRILISNLVKKATSLAKIENITNQLDTL